jgi:aspartyl-tRNA(Asn)/glutamyl-tRNA(Gln) amidotransferase subunit A
LSTDLALLTIEDLNRLYRAREASPVETIEAVFARIESQNGVLNAFCWLDYAAALQDARESERRWLRGESRGPLDGVPVSVKDLAFTTNWPTRRGCHAIPTEGRWAEDAPSVARCRERGAIIFGKTTVPEFGAKSVTHSKLCGITRNPWNPALTPGGSSGGASASVASGMGTIGLASDAGGSIRTPCSFTGLAGLKPTFGLVPDYPHSYFGCAAVVGPICRSVRDVAAVTTVISKPDDRDSYALPYTARDFCEGIEDGVARLRISFSPTLGFGKVEPEIATVVERTVRLLEQSGASVELIDKVVEDPSDMIATLMTSGLANAFRRFCFTAEDRRGMDPALVAAVEKGEQVQLLDYLAAIHQREELGAAMRRFHANRDLLITPASPIPPFEVGLDDPPPDRFACGSSWKFLNPLFNHTKQPAAVVPCGLTSEGLPIGIQIAGPLYADHIVLRAARAVEKLVEFVLPDFGPTLRCAPRTAAALDAA